MYKSSVKYDSNEDAFNQLYTWPYLDLIGSSLNTNEWKGYFIEGQPVLQSMSQQLKETGVFVDEKSQYKSDGLVKLFDEGPWTPFTWNFGGISKIVITWKPI